MKNEMNENKTPETDALRDLYENHEHRANFGDIWDLCECLENRLAVARDGFKELINAIETGSFSNGEYSRCEIKQAKETLTQTAPKP